MVLIYGWKFVPLWSGDSEGADSVTPSLMNRHEKCATTR
jgi:hypothetical protein